MEKAKVNILVAQFCYGGNGGISSIIPAIGTWWAKTFWEMNQDDRIGKIYHLEFSDTPLTMTRNKAVQTAKDLGCDFILMLDSDNEPDFYLNLDKESKPFWETSFNFAYDRLVAGKPTVIAAPYCGPPPRPDGKGAENVYVFHWENKESDNDNAMSSIEQYGRNHAAIMRGIHPAAALPTGVIIYSLSAFDLITHPYFYYEYPDKRQIKKDSTEDVVNTRNISMAGWVAFKEEVVFCNWDCWAAHYKPKAVGRPSIIPVDSISDSFVKAVNEGIESDDRIVHVDFRENLDKAMQDQELEQSRAETDEVKEEMELAEPSENGKPHNTGVEIIPRMLWGHKVNSVGHITVMSHLDALHKMVQWTANSVDRALRIIEVGSWVGESAVAMASAIHPDNGGCVYCVDHWEGSDLLIDTCSALGGPDEVHKHFVANCGDFYGTLIRDIPGRSVEIAAGLDMQEADIIFLDADHTYEGLRSDILAWMPHLRDDGILCGHDCCDEYPAVKKCLTEMFGSVGMDVSVAPGTSVWWISKEEWLEKAQQAAEEAQDERDRDREEGGEEESPGEGRPFIPERGEGLPSNREGSITD